MATELGQAYVQIMPSASGIGKNIEKSLNGESATAGSNAGKKMGGSLIATLGKVVVAAGVGALITKALNAGGELQQNLGGTEAVFGDFANNIQTSAKDAYKNMGLSASDYMATANKMGSLFQGSGLEQERALALTSDAMQRAADVASVMGLDTSMAMDSIAGAAKGNFTMMDNLGVAMNATSLEAYALEKGMNFKWNTASQAEKSELAMKMFMDRTGQYAGNFAKESEETFSGSFGAMKSSFQDALAAMSTGGDMGPALQNLGKTILTFATNLTPMITGILKQLPTILVTLISETGPQLIGAGLQAIGEIATGIGQALPTLIPTALSAIMAIVDTILDNIPMLIDSGLELVTGLADGVMDAIPVLLNKAPEIIKKLVAALTDKLPEIIKTGVELLTAIIEDLPTIITTILDALPEILENIIDALLSNLPLIIQAGVDLLTALVKNLPAIISAIVKAFPKIIDSMINAVLDNIGLIVAAGVDLISALVQNIPAIISAVIGAIPQIITALISALGSYAKLFVGVGKDLLMGLANGIGDAVGGVVRKAKEAAQKVLNSVKNFFGIRSPSTVFAEIGEYLDKGLANGISDNVKPITKAMDEVGEIATRSFESDMAFNATTATTSGRLSSSLDSGLKSAETTARNRLEELLERSTAALDRYLPQIANMQLVLDTGATVGALAPAIDKRLGSIQADRSRGR